MKVLTKRVIIENEEFVLIQDTDPKSGRDYVGTIPYTELDEHGRMKRTMNGFEIGIEFLDRFETKQEAINEALDRRLVTIQIKNMMDQGMTQDQVLRWTMNRNKKRLLMSR